MITGLMLGLLVGIALGVFVAGLIASAGGADDLARDHFHDPL